MADDWYAYASSEHFWFQWRLAALRRLLAGIDPGERILEVGCGNGIARGQLEAHYDRPIDGCDLNLHALQLAEAGRGRLYLYNVHDRRPEWDGQFDTIFLLDTLEHIETPVPLLQSLGHHLRPKGLLVLNVPAVECLYSRYDQLAGHVRRYRLTTLATELEQAGFRLLRSAYWGLTLVPVVALRKLLVRFAAPERVIARGFQPSSRLADLVLRGLMHTERGLLKRPWIGTSLAVVAEYAPVSVDIPVEHKG